MCGGGGGGCLPFASKAAIYAELCGFPCLVCLSCHWSQAYRVYIR